MDRKKILLVLLLAFVADSSHAQEKQELPPHESRADKALIDSLRDFLFYKNGAYVPFSNRRDTMITYTFSMPELQVNQDFMDSLNAILFNKKRSAAFYKSLKDFYLGFFEKDSLTYSLTVTLRKYPSKRSSGFFEHNGYRYWFYDDAPPGIILGTGPERRFSYDEYVPVFTEIYDPPFWFVKYNHLTGKMEDNEMPFFD